MKNTDNWIPQDLFLVYCGENSEKLSAFYEKALSKKTPSVLSVNWLALLVFPAWLGYRRQWALLATLAGILFVLPFLEAAFAFSIPQSAISGVFLYFGFMANGLLLSSANTVYLKLQKNGLSESLIREKISGRASKSPGLAIVALILCVGLIFLSEYLADVTFANS